MSVEVTSYNVNRPPEVACPAGKGGFGPCENRKADGPMGAVVFLRGRAAKPCARWGGLGPRFGRAWNTVTGTVSEDYRGFGLGVVGWQVHGLKEASGIP